MVDIPAMTGATAQSESTGVLVGEGRSDQVRRCLADACHYFGSKDSPEWYCIVVLGRHNPHQAAETASPGGVKAIAIQRRSSAGFLYHLLIDHCGSVLGSPELMGGHSWMDEGEKSWQISVAEARRSYTAAKLMQGMSEDLVEARCGDGLE